MKLSKCCGYPVKFSTRIPYAYMCSGCNYECEVEEYVKKEDLPNWKEIAGIIAKELEKPADDKCQERIAKAIAKRIEKEVK